MKKHHIEVDEDVFEALQEMATPLVDTPNTVLRRLLLEGRVSQERLSTHDRATPQSPRASLSSFSGTEVDLEDEADTVAYSLAPPGRLGVGIERGPYAALGDERRSVGGMSPRRFGKILCAREFPGETFERARRDRGSFRTMFESEERVLYFLNFNKPDSRNLWYKVTEKVLRTLRAASKPAHLVFTNPAERLAWVIPFDDFVDAYERIGGQTVGIGDLDVNVDVHGDRVRELDWSLAEYRREIG